MDRLAANPQGSGIYGMGGEQRPQYGEAMNLFNQVRDRDMQDFRDKANFMADLSMRQEMQRRRFPPEAMNNANEGGQPQNVVFHDPNQMTGYQKGELGIRQQQVGLEGQRLSQQGQLGQQAVDIRQQQADLQEKKNQQIHEQKQADLQRKIDDANKRYAQAKDALESRAKTAEDRIKAQQDIQKAAEERYKLELEQKQSQFDESKRVHDAQIAKMQEDAKRGNKTTTTEINPEGTKRKVTTKTGSSAETVQVTGKDGKTYEIPADKVDDWNENHAGETDESAE